MPLNIFILKMSTETSIQLFQSIMSSNNDERKNAEAKLNELKSMNFQEVLSVFVAGMQSSNSKVKLLIKILDITISYSFT